MTRINRSQKGMHRKKELIKFSRSFITGQVSNQRHSWYR